MEPPNEAREGVQDVAELRTHLGRSLQQREEPIVRGTIAVGVFGGMERLPAEDRATLVTLLFQLLAVAVREGRLESGTPTISELGRWLSGSQALDVRAVFNLVYLLEGTAVDEIGGDDSFGSQSPPWPVIARTVRRAGMDVCAALADYLLHEVHPAAIVDSLTTLHTRAVFVAALDKEIQRAERFGHPFAVILFDVDNLAEINSAHGYGAGDRIIERIGITIRNYFRETDWVARTSGDAFAVLLPEIQRVNAERLADRAREMVRERLQLHDHRSNTPFPVTVSAGIVIAESVDKSVRADHMMMEVEDATDLAKKAGRNCVRSADVVIGRSVTPSRAGISMD
jgi:diguanylate cyclase (GGDEF)-like protein